MNVEPLDWHAAHGDTFSISALHLSIKVPYFSNSGHKNEKVTPYLGPFGGDGAIAGGEPEQLPTPPTLARLVPAIPCCWSSDGAGQLPASTALGSCMDAVP
eukprot:SAG31_NODE_4530_length_3159_cov_2.970915_2_plen_101_part_00